MIRVADVIGTVSMGQEYEHLGTLVIHWHEKDNPENAGVTTIPVSHSCITIGPLDREEYVHKMEVALFDLNVVLDLPAHLRDTLNNMTGI